MEWKSVDSATNRAKRSSGQEDEVAARSKRRLDSQFVRSFVGGEIESPQLFSTAHCARQSLARIAGTHPPLNPATSFFHPRPFFLISRI